MAASEAALHGLRAGARLPTDVAVNAIGLGGLAAASASVTFALTNDAIGSELGEPLVIALLAVWITIAYVFGGLIAWSRRPASRFGPLMFVTSHNGFDPFPAAVGEAVAGTECVELASSVRFDQALADGTTEAQVTGVDPRTIATFYTFAWKDGSDSTLAGLGADGAGVTESFADDRTLAVGDRFPVETRQWTDARARRPRHPRPVRARSAPRCGDDRSGCVRRRVPATAEPVHVRRRGRHGRGVCARADGREVPRREAPYRARVRHEPDSGVLDDPEPALRVARVLRRGEPVRHGQHARALGVRADASWACSVRSG